jgi:hypothetical protein
MYLHVSIGHKHFRTQAQDAFKFYLLFSSASEGAPEAYLILISCYAYVKYRFLNGTSKSAWYNVSANYHKPCLPATNCTYLLPNTSNYMNNIFKPVIDLATPWRKCCRSTYTYIRAHIIDRALVYVYSWKFKLGLTTNNQQLKATDCYKLSLLKKILSK